MKTLMPVRPGRTTGPRTPEGKAISSRNAWRHGLSIPIRADPLWRPAVIALEHELARDGDAPRKFVRLFAEAVVELSRIHRRSRRRCLDRRDAQARPLRGASARQEVESASFYPSYWLPGRDSEGGLLCR